LQGWIVTSSVMTNVIALADPFSARQALLRGFCRQAKKAKPLRDMKRVAHGRPPYDVNPMRGWPLVAKKVDSELLPSMRSFTNQGGKRDSHCSVPSLRRRIDASRYGET